MYAKSHGVPQDYAEAAKWYRLAADQGDADAQYSLGLMYDKGEGVPQDYAEAVKWFRLAADQGDADAQVVLGYRYEKGEGVPQDNEKAVQLYEQACDGGNAPGCNNLAWELYLLNQNEDALVAANRSLDLRPDHVDTIDTQAHILAALGMTDDALAAFEKAMALGGSDRVFMYQNALEQHGYKVGVADGKYGKKTRAALIACLEAGCRLLE